MAKLYCIAILAVLSVVLKKTNGQCGTLSARPCYKSALPAATTCTGRWICEYHYFYYWQGLWIQCQFYIIKRFTSASLAGILADTFGENTCEK